VQKWVRDLPSFAVQYARACEAREDDTFDEIIEISDNPEIEPDRARVMIDARKWSLARMAPKKYGDVQRHVGADGGAIEVRHTRKLDISGLTDEQLDALEVALSGTVLQLEAEKTEE
jgi:hypothetical protein